MGKTKIITFSALALVLLGIIFIPGYLKIKTLHQQNVELEQQIAQIKQLNAQLQEEKEKLINDPLYLEQLARKKLGIVKKGEVVYKVLPSGENQ